MDINEFLQNIVKEIEIPESLYEKAINRYQSVEKFFLRDKSVLKPWNPRISMQGSFRLGTAIKIPSKEEDIDIDLNCLTDHKHDEVSQAKFKEIFGSEIKQYADTNNMNDDAVSEKRRCWRLNYAEGEYFHLDIVPAIKGHSKKKLNLQLRSVKPSILENILSITDNESDVYQVISDDWQSSNPEGYALWFQERMGKKFEENKKIRALELGKNVQDIKDYQVKTPLQYAIQILKRHRDMIYDQNDEVVNKNKPISIIITTLAAQAYNQEDNIKDALVTILVGMEKHIQEGKDGSWIVANPADPEENFADKWKNEPEKKEAFYEWLENARTDFLSLFQWTEREILEGARQFLGKSAVMNALNASDFKPSHEKNHDWIEEIRGNVTITAKYKKKSGFDKKEKELKNNSQSLPKNCSLYFMACFNGFSENTEIYWQVTNTGKEAKQANDLRGGKPFKGDKNHQESTFYKGTHTIQCFIVENGKCISKSNKFFVNIK